MLTAPVMNRLFSFALKPEVFAELRAAVEALKAYYIDREFHSLEVLESLALHP